MRVFSFRPALTMTGRRSKGLRGLAGKPLHPPLTDVPVGAYVLAAVFDVLSRFASDGLAHDLFRAATFCLLGGAVVSLLAAATGIADWLGSTQRGTQAWRTVNAHASVMVTVTVLVVVGCLLRLTTYDDAAGPTPVVPLLLSLTAAALTALGGALGGSLVYDYGFNVETAGDSPVWRESEADVLPGRKPTQAPAAQQEGAPR